MHTIRLLFFYWIFLFWAILSLLPISFFNSFLEAKVLVGADTLFLPENQPLLLGKKIGLITNQTGIDSHGNLTVDLFKQHAPNGGFSLVALFAPEHGLTGVRHAGENVKNERDGSGIPIYSLHGSTRRPTPEMLRGVTMLVYDIQDIGSRSYTYISTMFYAMEEAAKANIPFVVLDRPNPLGGELVDGVMLEESWRSFVGYINVPYCHGLTIGELAHYFNEEYHIGCSLTVIPMKGWNRQMTFRETELMWIPLFITRQQVFWENCRLSILELVILSRLK